MNDDRLKVLLFGDSITAGAAAVQGLDVTAVVDSAYPDLLAAELPNCQIVRDARAHRSTLQALDELPIALHRYQPHVVVLMLGGNDADINWRRFIMTRGAAARSKISLPEFARNMTKLASSVRTAGALPILTDIPDHQLRIRSREVSQLAGMDVERLVVENNVEAQSDTVLHEFRQQARQIAEALRVPFAGFAQRLDELGRNHVVGPDGVHPNAAGHAVIAQSLLAILRPLSVSMREWQVNYA